MPSKKHLLIPIEGMHCQACAISIEKGVQEIKGIQNASCSLNTGYLQIQAEKEVSLKEIEEKVQSLGYKVALLKKIYTIPEISYLSPSLWKEVEKIPSLVFIEKNPIKEEVSFYFLPDKFSPKDLEKIEKILQKGGISFQRKEDKKTFSQEDYPKKLKKNLLFTFLLILFYYTGNLLPISPYERALYHGILSSILLFLPGLRFLKAVYAYIKTLHANMQTLIGIALIAGYSFSMYHLIQGEIQKIYFEGLFWIVGFITLGNYIEASLKRKSQKLMQDLYTFLPSSARKIEKGEIKEIPTQEIQKGDILLVKPGEKIPVDSIILEGHSEVELAFLTGESISQEVQKGDRVLSGSYNISSPLKIQAEKELSSSLFYQILQEVEKAQNTKPSIQRLADKISYYFTPTMLFLSFLTFLLWGIIGGSFYEGLFNGISLLIIACPCALGIAIPSAIGIGFYKASKYGILFKTGEVLEKFPQVDTIAFDKTGTLTSSQLEVIYWEEEPIKNKTTLQEEEKNYLRILYAIEKELSHPIERAFTKLFYEEPFSSLLQEELPRVYRVRFTPGKGVSAKYQGKEYFIGRKEGSSLPYKKGYISVGFWEEDKLITYFYLKAPLLPQAKEIIKDLKKKYHILLLSGDRKEHVEETAKELQIQEFYAEVTPQEKKQIIEKYQKEGKKILMIGDGINDAIALSSSFLSCAVATSSEIAQSSADILFIRGNIEKLPFLFYLTKKIYRTMVGNLFWAFFYNTLAIPSAALGFLNPVIAASLMGFSSISVLLNSLRLLLIRRKS